MQFFPHSMQSVAPPIGILQDQVWIHPNGLYPPAHRYPHTSLQLGGWILSTCSDVRLILSQGNLCNIRFCQIPCSPFTGKLNIKLVKGEIHIQRKTVQRRSPETQLLNPAGVPQQDTNWRCIIGHWFQTSVQRWVKHELVDGMDGKHRTRPTSIRKQTRRQCTP